MLDLMANSLMAFLLFRGKVLNFCCGMPPAVIPWLSSHLSTSSAGARKVAEEAENNKDRKCDHLSRSFLFLPLAFETLGAIG